MWECPVASLFTRYGLLHVSPPSDDDTSMTLMGPPSTARPAYETYTVPARSIVIHGKITPASVPGSPPCTRCSLNVCPLSCDAATTTCSGSPNGGVPVVTFPSVVEMAKTT